MTINTPIEQEAFHQLQKLFNHYSNPAKADKMSDYMKNQFSFFGIQADQRRGIQKQIKPIVKNFRKEEMWRFINLCWNAEEREWQYAALDVLEGCRKGMNAGDLDRVEFCIVNKSWWDTVDFLASHVVGNIFKHGPEAIKPYTERWMNSGNIWLQRSCVLFQLSYGQSTDLELLAQCILQTKNSKEFFIQKANGWSLRQLSKHNPGWVALFLQQNPDLPTVTMREASKYL
ncbi:MAG TPA: DNA alkylation repair protein [Saprospiraceae bacterium]|nr:DNA alkylation repair protein [Saprospiraceae bacterium]